MVKTLIDLGTKDNTGKSPLHNVANTYKYYQVPETIINECEISNTDNKINSYSSPYVFDCSEVINLLVESGTDVKSEDILKLHHTIIL
nr:ankyrin repeat family protein [Oriental turtle dovepox virus]